MRNLFFDFETYWDKELTLSKLTYTDYVRHPDFEVLCMGMAFDNEPIQFVDKTALADILAQIDWANTRAIAHNMHFDGYILHHVFGIHPAEYFCTQAASEALFQSAIARSLDAVAAFLGVSLKVDTADFFKGKHFLDLTLEEYQRLQTYATGDIDSLRQVYQQLAMALPATEHRLMDLTLKMFCQPRLELSVPLLQEAMDEAIAEQEAKVAATGVSAAKLRSASFRELLVAEGIEPPTKLSPSNEDETIDAFASTDDEFMALLEHPNPRVRTLVAGRLAVKSTTYIKRPERMLKMATTGDKLFAVCLNYYRAHTGRWSGGNGVNPQNFVRGSKVRRAIKAPEGYVLSVGDSAQIEARTNAWMSGQEDIIEAYRQGRDIYSELATEIFNYPVTKALLDERFIGKTAELGLGFTMGWRRFQESIRSGSRRMLAKEINLDDDFCQLVVSKYRRKRYKITEFWKIAESMLYHMAYGIDSNMTWKDNTLVVIGKEKMICFPNGTYLYYPGLKHTEEGFVYFTKLKKRTVAKFVHRGLVVENIIQKFARDIVAWQLLNVAERYTIAATTHDELVTLIPTSEAEEGHAWVLEQLRLPPPWAQGLPLNAEGGFDVCYSK